jgi:YgiT-type zinc finger domain-containing protein
MNCCRCGSVLEPVVTDLPFKLSKHSIVIVRDLPVLQCMACSHYEIEDAVMSRIDALLKNRNRATELEIVRYAA